MNEQPNAETQANETFLNTFRHTARAIQPHPDFVATFEQQMTKAATPKAGHLPRPRFHRLGVAAAMLSLMALTVIAVPPLRTIAQEILHRIIPASSDRVQREITGMNPTGSLTFATLQEAETTLGKDFAELQHLPTGQLNNGTEITAGLKDAVYDVESGILVLHYEPQAEQPNDSGRVTRAYNNWWMWLTQTPAELYPDPDGDLSNVDGEVGASAQIETLSLTFRGHEVSAQFVRGGWNILGGSNDAKVLDAGGSVKRTVQWVNDGRLRLSWQDDGVVYIIHTLEDKVFNLTRDDLVRIAESME